MICPYIWCAFSFVSFNQLRCSYTCNSTRTGPLQSPKLIKWSIFWSVRRKPRRPLRILLWIVQTRGLFKCSSQELGYHMWEGKLLENQVQYWFYWFLCSNTTKHHGRVPLFTAREITEINGSHSDTRLFENNPLRLLKLSRQLNR